MDLTLLDFFCLGSCYTIINSKLVNFATINLKAGDEFDVNAVYLRATNLNMKARSGRFQLNYLDLGTTANLYLDRGDIIV